MAARKKSSGSKKSLKKEEGDGSKPISLPTGTGKTKKIIEVISEGLPAYMDEGLIIKPKKSINPFLGTSPSEIINSKLKENLQKYEIREDNMEFQKEILHSYNKIVDHYSEKENSYGTSDPYGDHGLYGKKHILPNGVDVKHLDDFSRKELMEMVLDFADEIRILQDEIARSENHGTMREVEQARHQASSAERRVRTEEARAERLEKAKNKVELELVAALANLKTATATRAKLEKQQAPIVKKLKETEAELVQLREQVTHKSREGSARFGNNRPRSLDE